MTIKKTEQVTVRLTPLQHAALDKLIEEGKAKNRAAAVQYLINLYQIKGSI